MKEKKEKARRKKYEKKNLLQEGEKGEGTGRRVGGAS
jgi:hypothetical protein